MRALRFPVISVGLTSALIVMLLGANTSAQNTPTSVDYERRIATLEAKLAKLEEAPAPRRVVRVVSAPKIPALTALRLVPSKKIALVSISAQIEGVQAAHAKFLQTRYTPSIPAAVKPPQINPAASTVQDLEANVKALTVTVADLTTQLNQAQNQIAGMRLLLVGEDDAVAQAGQALTTLQSNVQNLQQQVAPDEANIATLTGQINSDIYPRINDAEYNIFSTADYLYCTSISRIAGSVRPFGDLPGQLIGRDSNTTWNYGTC